MTSLAQLMDEGFDHPDSTVGKGQDRSQYEALPEPIKMAHSFKGWMWLSDAEKATLVSRETMPDIFEDGV